MKKLILISVLSLSLIRCADTTVFDQNKVRSEIPLKETQTILHTFASDYMKGRDSNSGGFFKAADFVTNYF